VRYELFAHSGHSLWRDEPEKAFHVIREFMATPLGCVVPLQGLRFPRLPLLPDVFGVLGEFRSGLGSTSAPLGSGAKVSSP
jgi:hypothetical protein